MQAANVEEGAAAVGTILGSYRLVRRLGAGMTSTVFEVEHLRIARRAAMKVLSPVAAIPNVEDRFIVEAQAVNAIRDPHIVEITDILESADGHPIALVMELLDGESLGEVMARDHKLTIDRVLRILAHVCEALAAVHAAGFAHRDLKPENVFLVRRDGDPEFVKLLDFGLAKPVGVAGPRAGCVTVEGTFLGSPAYASPEQAAGTKIDLRTDIYSLGVMAFELLTGELPFMADGFREVLIRHMAAPAPHLPADLVATDFGRTLDAILQTCLAKEPADRVLSAQQLAEMFHRMSGDADAADRLATRRPSNGWNVRRTGLVGGAFALAATLLLVVAVRHHHVRAAATVPERGASAAEAVSTPEVAKAVEPVPRAAAPVADGRRQQLKDAPRARRGPRGARALDEATTLDPFQ